MSALASWTLLVGLVAVFVVRAVRQERRIRNAEHLADALARIDRCLPREQAAERWAANRGDMVQ